MLQVIKLLHVLSVMLWMGTLFMLTSLLFRGEQWLGSYSSMQTLCQKIRKHIDLPCMCVAVITALTLVFAGSPDMKGGWFHMKMTGVLMLVGCDIWVSRLIRMPREKIGNKLFWFFCLFAVSVLMTFSAIYLLKPVKTTVQKIAVARIL